MLQKNKPRLTIRGNEVNFRLCKGEILVIKGKNSAKYHILCGDLATLMELVTHRGSPRLVSFKRRGGLYYLEGQNRGFAIRNLVVRVDKGTTKRLRADWTAAEWENVLYKLGYTYDLFEIYARAQSCKGIDYFTAKKNFSAIVKKMMDRK